MVEVLSSSLAQNGHNPQSQDSADHIASVARILLATNLTSSQENKMMSHEERHAMMKELSEQQAVKDELTKKRAVWRTPRRGWSITDTPAAPSQASPAAPPAFHGETMQRQAPSSSIASVPEQGEVPTSTVQHAPHPPQVRRPPLPAPRRSYSVMDYEPPARTHRPSARMGIFDLPMELHYAIFDFLDPIDSACFGLTHSYFYRIHRHMCGTVPLTSRRNGPNDLEWAWRFSGPLIHHFDSATNNTCNTVCDQTNAQHLERMRVKGQVYCRKCGISHCELHRHLRQWMGPDMEYCEITKKYGPRPAGGVEGPCYRKSPKNRFLCGRHARKPLHSEN